MQKITFDISLDDCKTSLMIFKGFIFDLDGTLIDSRLDFIRIRQDLGIQENSPILEEISTWPQEKQIWAHDILNHHELRGVEDSELYPGVKVVLNTLAQKNIPTALFTRNSRKAAELALKKHNFCFSMVISRDDALPKPDPSGLLKIVEAFALSKNEILYVGDYLYDLQAGLAAQIPTALFFPLAFSNETLDFDTSGASFLFQEFTTLLNHC